MTDQTHKIFPHGEPQELMSGVWLVSGSLPFPLKRSMTIVRLPDGTLLLHSVIAMSDTGMAKLDALGKPSIMIIPHGGHRMDAPFYKARYPDIRVVCPAGVRAKVEEVIKSDATCEEALPPLGVRLHEVRGFKHGEIGYEIDTEGGKLLILSDSVANSDPSSGLGGFLMRMVTDGVKGRLGVPRIVRFMMMKDKAAVRASLNKLAEIPNVKVLTVAHGRALTERCSEALKEAAAAL
jgi:hypothetical protein